MRIFVEYDALMCVLLLINNILTHKSSHGDHGKYSYNISFHLFITYFIFINQLIDSYKILNITRKRILKTYLHFYFYNELSLQVFPIRNQ